jgi:hypothetical protein
LQQQNIKKIKYISSLEMTREQKNWYIIRLYFITHFISTS